MSGQYSEYRGFHRSANGQLRMKQILRQTPDARDLTRSVNRAAEDATENTRDRK